MSRFNQFGRMQVLLVPGKMFGLHGEELIIPLSYMPSRRHIELPYRIAVPEWLIMTIVC